MKRTPARIALADAIAAKAACVQSLAEARAAVSAAWEKQLDASRRLDELRASSSESLPAGALVAALASGREFDLSELDRPAKIAASKIEDAEREVTGWRNARQLSEAEVSFREKALASADWRVNECSKRVLAESGAVDRLIGEVTAKQREIVKLRISLSFLIDNSDMTTEDRRAAQTFLGLSSVLPGGLEWRREWYEFSSNDPWAAALEALKHSADAPLPLETSK